MAKEVHDIWALGKSPIKIEIVQRYLQNYPLKEVAQELSDGFLKGFRLKYTGPRIHRESPNRLSAFQHTEALKDKIQKETNLGRIAGPFKFLSISNLQVSPCGIVPKSDGVTWRLISHLSYPTINGINDFIDPVHCAVRYTSFDRVVEMVSKLGKRAEIGVIDIKNAFRLLRVFPGDCDLLGLKIDDKCYIKCLSMGCSISCNMFEKNSTFLHWLVKKKSGLSTLDHYLDDFIFAGQENSERCKTLMNYFLSISQELGIPIADEKSVGTVTVLTFLGLISIRRIWLL